MSGEGGQEWITTSESASAKQVNTETTDYEG